MTQPIRILYIDDYPFDRELVRDALEKEHGGFDIVEAASREEFESRLAQGDFDLILSDFNILGFEGLQVLETVRATGSNLPVIIVTGTGSEEIAAEAIKRGAADYVIKDSRHIRHLPYTIYSVLEKKRLEDEHRQAEIALRESEERYRQIVETAQEGIWMIDADSKTTFVNPKLAEMFGYAADEMMGAALFDFMDKEGIAIATAKLEARRQGISEQHEFKFLRKDGVPIWTLLNSNPIISHTGDYLGALAMISDITERKQAENELKLALADKEILLQELYHRTKNNMQAIIGLIDMQYTQCQDEQVLMQYRDIQNRIRSMALVHQKLYQSQNLSSIDLGEYVRELTALLMESYQVSPDRISPVFKLERIPLLIDTVIPCGLILNELITNVLKHAFPHNERGELRIDIGQLAGNEILLQVADNGVGLPSGFDPRKNGGVGIQTVYGIAEYQLRGKLTCLAAEGVTWQLRFDDTLYQPRV
ncbi:MAG: PAS domain S-box protein [Anaerolineales bacterium]|nr:PAS domain S-box protein [Anaerolineales bacterium]